MPGADGDISYNNRFAVIIHEPPRNGNPKQAISQLCANSQYAPQNIKILFKHLICVSLLYYRRIIHQKHLLSLSVYYDEKFNHKCTDITP